MQINKNVSFSIKMSLQEAKTENANGGAFTQK